MILTGDDALVVQAVRLFVCFICSWWNINKFQCKQISPFNHQSTSNSVKLVLNGGALSLRQNTKRNNKDNQEWAVCVIEHHLYCCLSCEGVFFFTSCEVLARYKATERSRQLWDDSLIQWNIPVPCSVFIQLLVCSFYRMCKCWVKIKIHVATEGKYLFLNPTLGLENKNVISVHSLITSSIQFGWLLCSINFYICGFTYWF